MKLKCLTKGRFELLRGPKKEGLKNWDNIQVMWVCYKTVKNGW